MGSAKVVCCFGGQDCGSQCSLETLCDRSCNWCDSETWASGFMTEVFVGPGQLCQLSQREMDA